MENVIHRITINPEICNGKPIIRNMRITVRTVLEYLGAGETIDNILEAYPTLGTLTVPAWVAGAVIGGTVGSTVEAVIQLFDWDW